MPFKKSSSSTSKDDDAASIRTTNSTFSTLSLRGRRWGGSVFGTGNDSSATLPSYEDAQAESAEGSSAAANRAAFKRDYKKEKAQHDTCNLNEDDEDDDAGPPRRVVIDDAEVDAFVGLDEMEAHLTLLTAFRDLQSRCYALNKCVSEADKDRAWSTYLRRATYRLSLYIDLILRPLTVHAQGEQEELLKVVPRALLQLSRASAKKHADRTMLALPQDSLPPLDVAMAWHAYMLNPGRYAEDIARVANRRHLHLLKFPLIELAQCVKFTPADGAVLDVSAACIQRWQTMTSWSFNLAYVAPPLPTKRDDWRAPPPDEGMLVPCPFCARRESPMKGELQGCILSWDTLNGRSDWKASCPALAHVLTPDTIRGCMLVKDIESWLQKQPSTEDNAGLPFYMRGGLVSARNGRLFESDPYATVLCRLFPYKRTAWPSNDGMMALMSHLNPDDAGCTTGLRSRVNKVPRNDLKPQDYLQPIPYVAQQFGEACKERVVLPYEDVAVELKRRLAMMISYYIDADILVPDCSVDLGQAIKRQFSFVEEMDKLGWLDTATFADGQGDVAQPALLPEQRRPLLARAIVRYHRWLNVLALRNELLCPTLDIDLAWHTHQLRPSYYADCFTATQMFIDHNDKISAPTLGNAYDNTATLWYEMYKQPYSVCGCAVHTGSTSIRASLRTLKNNLASRPKKDGVTDMHHELNPIGRQRANATHPSAHNAVVAPDSSTDKIWLSRRATKQERDMEKGVRDAGHADVFIKGYGMTPLRPYEHVPSTSCDYVPGKCMTGGAEAEPNETGPSRCVGVREVVKPNSKGGWDVTTSYGKSVDNFRGPTGSHYSTIGASSAIVMFPSRVKGELASLQAPPGAAMGSVVGALAGGMGGMGGMTFSGGGGVG